MHKIGAMIMVDPAGAKRVLLEAFRKAKTSKRHAAEILEVDEHTFARWVDKLNLHAAMDAMGKKAEKEGWHHGRNKLGGRPPRVT